MSNVELIIQQPIIEIEVMEQSIDLEIQNKNIEIEVTQENIELEVNNQIIELDIPSYLNIENAYIAGKNAYELAVENGFIGTEQERLDSLKGEQGDPGNDGPPGPAGTTDYNELDNIPDNFPPSAHTHPISDIIDLQDKLDSKAGKDWRHYTGKVFYNGNNTTVSGGKVLECEYETTTIYRYITDGVDGNGYPTTDGFYESFDGTTVSDLIVTRS